MLTLLLQAACAWLTVSFLRRMVWSAQHSLPPGPWRLPFVGNIWNAPSAPTFMTYKKWSDIYGSPIVRLKIFGKNIIVLNTLQAARDLLDKRSAIYSDRPRGVMFIELCGFDWTFGMARYGKGWRTHRKIFHSQFNSQVAKRHRPVEEKATHMFLNLLLATPDDFLNHTRLWAGSQVGEMVYGFKVLSRDDPYIKIAEEAMACVKTVLSTGAYMVDFFPLLKHVPAWFPGAKFRRQAQAWSGPIKGLKEVPYATYLERAAQGDTPDCVTTKLREDLHKYEGKEAPYTEDDMKAVLATVYAAGIDTLVASTQSFILAMVLHPDVQAKAQAEIDKVCQGRLPDFDDRENLPYTEAVLREVTRWSPVAPEGLPHSSIEDDVYEGYFIPKGSIVIPNIWAILHSEAQYPDPLPFNPDRFIQDGILNTDVPNPDVAAFGFGRRMCPGRFLAHDASWIIMVCMLAVFDILPKKDAHGRSLVPSGEYNYMAICDPKPFECDIRPRSEQHRAMTEAARGLT